MRRFRALAMCLLISIYADAAQGQHGDLTTALAALTPEQANRYRELDARALHTFTNIELADFLSLRAELRRQGLPQATPSDEFGFFAQRSLGQPYRLNASRPDLSEGDCVCFVERSLAMGLSPDWETFYKLSERLRYKDGIVDYRNRNFFTLGDWLPNNTTWGLLHDITPQLGGAQEFTHVVRPKVFEERPAAPGSRYTRVIFKGSDYRSPDKEVRTNFYTPRDRVAGILPALNTGDVVLVIRASAGGHSGCDHMGLIARADAGQVNIVHCAPPRARQENILKFLRNYPHVKGFVFLRLTPNAAERVAQEVTRVSPSITVPTPSQEDNKVQRLRQSRAAGGN